MSLQNIIPTIVVGYDPDKVPLNSTSTTPYAPRLAMPPMSIRPYHIVYHPSLLQDMMDSLREYLQTAPGANDPPDPYLTLQINEVSTPQSHANSPLSNKVSTTETWTNHFAVIKRCVREIDQNPTFPQTSASTTIYGQTPDLIVHSIRDGPARIHREDKSHSVFSTHAPNVLRMARAVDEQGALIGTRLRMADVERDHWSIIFKIGLSMISGAIPYAILFGGDRFMVFSLFMDPNTIGAPRYGLYCSDIVKVSNVSTPFIPLVTFMLLGRDTPALLSSKSEIPVCLDSPVLQSEAVVTRGPKKRYSMDNNLTMTKFDSAIISLQTPGVPETRTFTTIRRHVQMQTFSTSSSLDSLGPLTPPWPAVHISSSPSIDQTKTAYLAPALAVNLNLTICIGHGVAGQVYLGTIDGEPMVDYALKLAPYNEGRAMLLNEASIYEHLKPLQGQHIALVFAYLTSETADALFMEYMGCESNDMNSFTYSQRTSLWEELCAIHGMGVIHGDLRLANIVTLDGSDPHFIDFTHGSLHDCKGPAECDELTQAREFLLLLEDSDGKPQ